MNGRVFLDSNVLIYGFGKIEPQRTVAEGLLTGGFSLSVHVLHEFANVASRKLRMSWDEILEALASLRSLCPRPRPITIATHEKAIAVVSRYRYHIFDALVIAAALEASCRILYSEDMQDGQVIEGLTIRNPFREGVV